MNKSFSIGIPCHVSHVALLQDIVDSYNNQTLKPTEIIISVSESRKRLNLTSEIPLKIIYSKNRLYAGENRNIIMDNNTSDYVLFSDADDIPHPSRVECIIHTFSNYKNIDFVLHKYSCSPNSAEVFRQIKIDYKEFLLIKNEITSIKVNNYNKLDLESGYHHGAVSIRKDLYDKVKWTNKIKGQDVQFIEMCISNKFQGMGIENNLYYYRNELSSKAETLNNNKIKKYLKLTKSCFGEINEIIRHN